MNIKVHLFCLISTVIQIKCLLGIIMGKKAESHAPHETIDSTIYDETMATSYKAFYLRNAQW